jgi:sn-glycerol 3-phosphate transport system permease protein
MVRREWFTALLFIAPSAVLLFAFTYLPAVQSLLGSLFTTPRGRRPARFAGLENYERLINDDVFLQVLINNSLYALVTIPVAIALAIVMALLVNSAIPGRSLLRMSFFAPTMLPMIAVANIWLFFYAPGFGLLDQIRTLLGLPQQNLLGSPDTVLWAVMAVAVWKEAGFFMIFYLAALQSIPPTFREAASIEGANPWHIFWKITFPLMMPTTLFVAINALINSFRIVDHIVIMTDGGPNFASTLLLYYIYETAFSYWDTAYGATLTAALLVILGLIALGQFKLLDRRTHYR